MDLVIIQLKLESDMSGNPIGTLPELEKRHQIEQWLDEALRESQVGDCDGGQQGGGSMEIFCYVNDLSRGVEIIKKTLINWELIYFSTIAHISGDKIVVDHPEGKTDFSFWPG